MALFENAFRSNREGMGLVGPILDLFKNRWGGVDHAAQDLSQQGYGEHVNSWISHGDNQPIQSGDAQNIFGQDLHNLANRLNIPVDTLAQYVAELLPQVVDQSTPAGRLDNNQASGWTAGLDSVRQKFGL